MGVAVARCEGAGVGRLKKAQKSPERLPILQGQGVGARMSVRWQVFTSAGGATVPGEELEGGRVVNKVELVGAVADKTGLTKRDAEKAITSLVETIEEALKKGDKVSLVGFGTFEVRNRKPRVGRNPQTGEEIKIPASRVPSFKAGKSLKESVV